MGVFGRYAAYYDLLYRDKDYAGEAQFVGELLRKHVPHGRSVLELGCGTGRHARLLAQQGYCVHGVDGSAEMLQGARANSVAGQDFVQGDIRSVRVGRHFDAIIALFHVVSYQTTNADLIATFQTARAHLGGVDSVFIFDLWYGPAVLTIGPSVRVKRFEDEQLAVTRIAEPVTDTERCVVDVHYQVFIRDKTNEQVEELRETHQMRYLFKPEVESLLSQAGLRLADWGRWMDQGQPDSSSWGVYFVARPR